MSSQVVDGVYTLHSGFTTTTITNASAEVQGGQRQCILVSLGVGSSSFLLPGSPPEQRWSYSGKPVDWFQIAM